MGVSIPGYWIYYLYVHKWQLNKTAVNEEVWPIGSTVKTVNTWAAITFKSRVLFCEHKSGIYLLTLRCLGLNCWAIWKQGVESKYLYVVQMLFSKIKLMLNGRLGFTVSSDYNPSLGSGSSFCRDVRTQTDCQLFVELLHGVLLMPAAWGFALYQFTLDWWKK